MVQPDVCFHLQGFWHRDNLQVFGGSTTPMLFAFSNTATFYQTEATEAPAPDAKNEGKSVELTIYTFAK